MPKAEVFSIVSTHDSALHTLILQNLIVTSFLAHSRTATTGSDVAQSGRPIFDDFFQHLWISFTPNAAVLFVDVAIQPEVRFIAKQNSLMKIGNNGNLVLGPFDESSPCLNIFKMLVESLVRTYSKNDEGHNVTVNGDRYRAMITNFFIPELNNYDVQELWFQQDGATCHTARATIDLLKDRFGDHLVSRFEPVNWPPRSCDLTPLDYFLWGYVKSLVYADKPQTLDHLEDNIRRVIADIRPQMLEK
ncbi:putative transposable element [Trichonephila clavipes]|nr:putative transposable element [Trichonephila clavipes]